MQAYFSNVYISVEVQKSIVAKVTENRRNCSSHRSRIHRSRFRYAITASQVQQVSPARRAWPERSRHGTARWVLSARPARQVQPIAGEDLHTRLPPPAAA